MATREFDFSQIAMGAFSIINLLILICGLGISIYCLILFIKLAIRGIKALDIYIEKNKNIR